MEMSWSKNAVLACMYLNVNVQGEGGQPHAFW